MIKWNFS